VTQEPRHFAVPLLGHFDQARPGELRGPPSPPAVWPALFGLDALWDRRSRTVGQHGYQKLGHGTRAGRLGHSPVGRPDRRCLRLESWPTSRFAICVGCPPRTMYSSSQTTSCGRISRCGGAPGTPSAWETPPAAPPACRRLRITGGFTVVDRQQRRLRDRAHLLGFTDLDSYLVARCEQDAGLTRLAGELHTTIDVIRRLIGEAGIHRSSPKVRSARQRRRAIDQRLTERAAELGFADLGAYLADRMSERAWALIQVASELGIDRNTVRDRLDATGWAASARPHANRPALVGGPDRSPAHGIAVCGAHRGEPLLHHGARRHPWRAALVDAASQRRRRSRAGGARCQEPRGGCRVAEVL